MVREREVQLLYYTNTAVAAAEMMRFARVTRWDRTVKLVEPNVIRGDSDELPPALRILNPAEVIIYDDKIELECGSFLLRFGLVVFKDSEQGNGAKKLGERIWFYSGDGRVPKQ